MRIRAEHEHEAKVGDVLHLLTDPGSLCSLGAAAEGTTEVDFSDRPRVTVECDRDIRLAEDVTDSLMARLIHVHQRIAWTPAPERDGTMVAAIGTEISGAPLAVNGTFRIEPTPAGCRSVVELDLECTMAVLGGRLMAAVVPLATRELGLELHRLDTAVRAAA